VYNLLLKYVPPEKYTAGDNYEYSNTGYNILALLVERINGQSFQDFTAENIFGPLEMRNSYVNPPDGLLNDEHRAKGFILNTDGTRYVARDWHYQNGLYGDGGVISTVHDLLLWDIAPHLWQGTITLEKDYKIEYKITRGSWESEALYEKGIIPDNFFFTVSLDDKKSTFKPWINC